MQMIWIRVAVSISYGDNHYATNASRVKQGSKNNSY